MTRTQQIDRATWARLLTELMAAAGTPPGELAGMVGVHPRTVTKWRKGEVEVTVESVRDVCRAVGYPPVRALIEVGFFQPGEGGVAGLVARAAAAPDPLVVELDKHLNQEAWPREARQILRRMLTHALADWLAMFRAGPGPAEPRMRGAGAVSKDRG